jgi:O-methyltransferase
MAGMPLSIQDLFEKLPALRGAPLAIANRESHSVVVPYATYSPWQDDPAFAAAFAAIGAHTLVDIYRCYDLWMLAGQAARLDGDVLEVGVWRGGTGCLIATRYSSLGAVGTVFLCDGFTGIVKAGAPDRHYRGGEHADCTREIVATLAGVMGVANVQILEGIFPEDTGAAIAARRFSFCHIDVDVYESARDVLDWVWPRLQPGGIVVFDDYGFATCPGVTQLVNERLGTPNALIMHNLNGHAVVVKLGPG